MISRKVARIAREAKDAELTFHSGDVVIDHEFWESVMFIAEALETAQTAIAGIHGIVYAPMIQYLIRDVGVRHE